MLAEKPLGAPCPASLRPTPTALRPAPRRRSCLEAAGIKARTLGMTRAHSSSHLKRVESAPSLSSIFEPSEQCEEEEEQPMYVNSCTQDNVTPSLRSRSSSLFGNCGRAEPGAEQIDGRMPAFSGMHGAWGMLLSKLSATASMNSSLSEAELIAEAVASLERHRQPLRLETGMLDQQYEIRSELSSGRHYSVMEGVEITTQRNFSLKLVSTAGLDDVFGAGVFGGGVFGGGAGAGGASSVGEARGGNTSPVGGGWGAGGWGADGWGAGGWWRGLLGARLRPLKPLDPMHSFYLIASFVEAVYVAPRYVGVVMKWGMHEVDASHQLSCVLLDALELLRELLPTERRAESTHYKLDATQVQQLLLRSLSLDVYLQTHLFIQ